MIETVTAKDAYFTACLSPFIKAISQESVIDIDRGVIELTRRYAQNCRGVSDSAIEAAGGRSDDDHLSEIATGSCDYAIGLNSTSDVARLDEGLANLTRVSRKGFFFSYGAPTASNTGAALPPPHLLEALRRHESVKSLGWIGCCDNTAVYVALKQPGLPSSAADATLSDIALGCNETEDWRLLLELTRLSREKFGFFPNTITRTVEYPWFARKVAAHAHRRVLDVGAGVCALPLWFAQGGLEVVTIDHSPHIRDAKCSTGWNEWGYLDYGQFDDRIASHHVDAQYYQPDRPFDAIYSVSVIEHMPAAVRRKILSKIPRWLAPGGAVFLSLDLIPGVDQLWPLCEGRHVDLEGQHGAYQDVVAELEAVGLRIVETSIRRRMAGSRTDLAFIEARKP